MTTITETTPIIDKIRAGRRAALASLHTRLGHSEKIVSIFENSFPPRQTVAEFHSVRAQIAHPRRGADARRSLRVLTDVVAA